MKTIAVTCPGIHGSTLLGFLASVGSLRLLAEHVDDARLSFEQASQACVLHARVESAEEMIELVVKTARSKRRAAELSLLGDEVEKPSDVTPALLEALRDKTLGLREQADFISGLVCSNMADESAEPAAAETVLCAANGASHQKMFVTMRDLVRLATASQLRETLAATWKFADSVPKDDKETGSRKPTLRWDEGADRLYALRFRDPTNSIETFATQFGAYLLAAAALPWLPVMPQARGGLTASSKRKSPTEYDFHFPLWSVPATSSTIRAYLLSGEAIGAPDAARARGVFALFRARRRSLDKGKLVFSPAVGVW